MTTDYAQRHAELQKTLGEPDLFVPHPEGSGMGTGYWKGDGGVFSYSKYPDGYDAYTRREYPDSLIDILNKVKGT
jgi:hypothetical protein